MDEQYAEAIAVLNNRLQQLKNDERLHPEFRRGFAEAVVRLIEAWIGTRLR